MSKSRLHKILTFTLALVWGANGLVCKVLNLVPRHEQIVASILGDAFSRPLTICIGMLEIAMAIWILTKFQPRLNALTQILIVALMNLLEFLLVPDLLLWGRYNAVFALVLIAIVYYWEFVLNKKLKEFS